MVKVQIANLRFNPRNNKETDVFLGQRRRAQHALRAHMLRLAKQSVIARRLAGRPLIPAEPRQPRSAREP